MFRRLGICAGLLVALLMSAVASPAWAQARKPPTGPKVTLNGKVFQVNRGLIAMVDAASLPVLVKINPAETRVVLSGKAKPDFLTPGMFLQFNASVNKEGEIQGELDKLLLYDLVSDETNQPTFYAESEPDSEGIGKYFVRGQIRANKKGALQIAVPGKMLRGRVKDDADITVGISNYSFAKQGDAITVNGSELRKAQQNLPGQVVGTRVDITVAELLTTEKTK